MKYLVFLGALIIAFTSNQLAANEVQGLQNNQVNVDQLKQPCTACHGADGNSSAPMNPKLAGQNAPYLLKQLRDIKSGKRVIAVMTGQLDNMSDKQLEALADYYASQKVTSLSPVDESLRSLGEKIYRLGSLEKGVPACTGCHSPTGKGNAGAAFPALGGQHASYIASSLRAFREGAEYENKGRSNDEMQGVMRSIALGMSDKEIDAVASYISSLY